MMGFWPYTIEECCEILNYLRFPINSEKRFDIKGEFPYYGANGVQDYINQWKFDDDLILIAEDGGNFEQFATRPIAYRVSGKCWVNNHAHVLKAKEKFSQDFIFYSLEHKNILFFIAGGTRSKLTQGELKKIVINHPPKVEADKIASILSKADTAIEQTEKIIAKYQRIKTGLMQDLLTKGIDEHGNIRNEKTHSFKTEYGLRVPEEWRVDVLDNLVTDVLDFKANGSFETLTENVKYYYEQNYARLIRLTDLRNGLKGVGVYIDEKGFQFLKKTRLVEGDILISCVGEYTGFVCQMPKVPYYATIAPNMFVIRFKENLVNSFTYRYMTSYPFQNQILVVSTSSATKLLNNPNLRSLKLVIPPTTEQERIANKFESVEKLIEDNQFNLLKLQSLKTGLMQDLLSGKLRVKIKEETFVNP